MSVFVLIRRPRGSVSKFGMERAQSRKAARSYLIACILFAPSHSPRLFLLLFSPRPFFSSLHLAAIQIEKEWVSSRRTTQFFRNDRTLPYASFPITKRTKSQETSRCLGQNRKSFWSMVRFAMAANSLFTSPKHESNVYPSVPAISNNLRSTGAHKLAFRNRTSLFSNANVFRSQKISRCFCDLQSAGQFTFPKQESNTNPSVSATSFVAAIFPSIRISGTIKFSEPLNASRITYQLVPVLDGKQQAAKIATATPAQQKSKIDVVGWAGVGELVGGDRWGVYDRPAI